MKLSDPIGQFLPELSPELRRLTIAKLLEHSSGLGELGPGLDAAMRRARTVTERVAPLADSPIAFNPGSDFRYSNRGYISRRRWN